MLFGLPRGDALPQVIDKLKLNAPNPTTQFPCPFLSLSLVMVITDNEIYTNTKVT